MYMYIFYIYMSISIYRLSGFEVRGRHPVHFDADRVRLRRSRAPALLPVSSSYYLFTFLPLIIYSPLPSISVPSGVFFFFLIDLHPLET